MTSFLYSSVIIFSILLLPNTLSHIQAFIFPQIFLLHPFPLNSCKQSLFKYPYQHSQCVILSSSSQSIVDEIATADDATNLSASGLTPEQEDDLDELLTDALDRLLFIMEADVLRNCNSESLRDLFQTCVDTVRVGESTIPGAGRGLFAKQDISAGMIVAFYPIHSIGCKFPSRVCQSVQMSENPDEMIDNENSSYSLLSLVDRPLCGVDLKKEYNNAQLVVDMNPKNTIQEGWYCGYCNDAAIVRFAGDEEYYPESRGAQNVEIVPFSAAPFHVGITTRNVKAGEELFVSYGYNYWINNKGLFPDGPPLVDGKMKMTSAIVLQEQEAASEMNGMIRAVEENYRDASIELQMAFDSLGRSRQDEMEQGSSAPQATEISMKGRNPFRRLIQVVLYIVRRVRGLNNH